MTTPDPDPSPDVCAGGPDEQPCRGADGGRPAGRDAAGRAPLPEPVVPGLPCARSEFAAAGPVEFAGRAEGERWTVGADAVTPHPWSGEWVSMPAGLLHAVTGDGMIAGRGVCLAPVVLLDPADWRWPEDGGDDWPLCWICFALTS